MTSAQIAQAIQDKFGEQITAVHADDKHPRVHCDARHWRAIAEFLRNDRALQFDWLANLSGVDYVADNQFCVVYDLYSFDHKHTFAVKVYTARTEDARFPSVVDLWPAADWHEREAYDMFGMTFDGHPDSYPLHIVNKVLVDQSRPEAI